MNIKVDQFNSPSIYQPTIFLSKPPKVSQVMWRNLAKQVSSKTTLAPRFSRIYSFLGFCPDSVSSENSKFRSFYLNSYSGIGFFEPGFRIVGQFSTRDEFLGRPSLHFARNQVNINGLCQKSFASVAEAVAVSSTDVEDDAIVGDEVQILLAEMKKENRKNLELQRRSRFKTAYGMGWKKYQALKRRQVKIETEAWEQAAKEYTELLHDMCKHKLAPNLPYMKSLFLGWFEPLCGKIAEEQELCMQGKLKAAYAKYLIQLPADMISIITMHKLMGLLMTGGEHGTARVVQAACLIGDAVEQEVRDKQSV